MNPNQVYYSSNAGPGRGKRILIVAGLFLLVLGAIIYLILSNGSGNDKNAQNTPQGTPDKIALNSVRDFSLEKPSNTKGYIQGTNFTVDIGDFTTTDNGCNLQFGVVGPGDLPGDTQEEIAILHLGAVGEPSDGSELVLKDSKTNQKYTMPTLNFDYDKDGMYYRASYSVVILRGDKRAYVRRYCSSQSPVSQGSIDKINKKASEIKVKTDSGE